MATTPQGVVPSDAGVKVFHKSVAGAYERILSTVEGADLSDATRRKQALNQIRTILQDADQDVRAWIAVQIPAFYEMGMFETTKELIKEGRTVAVDKAFATFHKEAIAALSNETYNNIAEGMAGLARTGEQLISTAARDSILKKIIDGQITGESRKDINKKIQDELKREGLHALVDKSGKTWDLSRYGDMLARTKLTQAHNSGVVNRMADNGNDLVMVSSHYGTCEICAPWENRVLSVSGKENGFDSLGKAEASGLFHPNCRHTMTPYHNEYFDQSQVWDTERQAYVDVSEMQADDFHREQFMALAKTNSELMRYSKQNFIGKEAWSSTVGMKKQYLGNVPVKFDGSEVLPEKMTAHMVDDFARKVQSSYPELGDGVVDRFNIAFKGKEYKTLEALNKDLLNYAKAYQIPANPLKYRVSEIEKAYFTGTEKLPPKIEKMVVLNPKTQVVDFTTVGSRNKVGIPMKYWGQAEDSIFIHNHPAGSSFSLQDLLAGAKLNVSELRVVTKDYTYIIARPAGGWGSAKEIKTAYEKGLSVLKQKYGTDQTVTALVKSNDMVGLSHAHLEGVTTGLKLNYSRVKTEFLEPVALDDWKTINVYRGEGSAFQDKVRATSDLAGGGMFGKGAYYSTDPKIAAKFGTVKEAQISLHKDEILEIGSQTEYERVMKEAIKKFPDAKEADLIPLYAKSKGFKAVSGSASFDDLAGINIIDQSIFVR